MPCTMRIVTPPNSVGAIASAMIAAPSSSFAESATVVASSPSARMPAIVPETARSTSSGSPP